MEEIVIHIDDVETKVIVGPARKIDTLKRAEMMTHPDVIAGEGANELMKQVAFFEFPTCIMATKEPPEIRNMSFADFVEKVDDNDIQTVWLPAAYRANPQWRLGMQLISGMVAEATTPPLETKSETKEEIVA